MIKDSRFQSPWWLKGPHLQTIWPSTLRRPLSIERRRERIHVDHDFIDLDWTGGDAGPITIILHGLTGSSNSNYVLGLQHSITQLGWRSVAINFRGCSGEPNHLAHSYHSGETNDLKIIYKLLHDREPNTPLFVVGYSLGGNVLLKWLGEESVQDSQILAAVAVSVPFLLQRCADKMDRGLGKIYRNRFIKNLVQSIDQKKLSLSQLNKMNELKRLEELGDISAVKSFWEFDDQITAKLFNFSSADDYYQRASCLPFLKKIKIPTLILHAKDDPLVCETTIPRKEDLSESILLEIAESGGHVGFVTGKHPFAPHYWLEERIPNFLQEQL